MGQGCGVAKREWPPVVQQVVTARMSGLLLELIDAQAESGLTVREVADRAGVSERTLKTWRSSDPGTPGARSLVRVGLVLGCRLEVAPAEASMPGYPCSDLPLRPSAPPIPGWAAGDSHHSPCGFGEERGVEDRTVYLLRLIGAELRWARSELPRDSRWPGWAALVSHDTKVLVEIGPQTVPPFRAASPAAIGAMAGEFGLEIVWRPAGSGWRVRPWEAVDAPSAPRIRRTRAPRGRR